MCVQLVCVTSMIDPISNMKRFYDIKIQKNAKFHESPFWNY